jgi:exodeoxyribonuclease VII small subunit
MDGKFDRAEPSRWAEARARAPVLKGAGPADRMAETSRPGGFIEAVMAKKETTGAQVPADISALSFEEALAELQELVKRLERGESKLDEAIGAYERGAHLKRHCEAKLREAELKVEQIVLGQDGQPQAETIKLD